MTTISVHISTLFQAFRLGVGGYFDDVESDDIRRANVASAAGAWLASMPSALVTDLLDAVDRFELRDPPG